MAKITRVIERDYSPETGRDYSPEKMQEIKERVDYLEKTYADGKPLFPRSELEELNRQLTSGCNPVYIKDYKDVPQKNALELSEDIRGDCGTPVINYSSYQALMRDKNEEKLCMEPLRIAFTEDDTRPACPIEELQTTHAKFLQTWKTSKTFASFQELLAQAVFPTNISKIVCFGLGSLQDSKAADQPTSFWQHFAAKHIAETLEQKTGVKVQCYTQDPIFSAADKKFLKTIDIIVLEDPQGFLEVDEHAIVMSVSPNVPVKQIVADLAKPAGMLWNKVRTEEEEEELDTRGLTAEQKKEREREGPTLSTDPDSTRTRELIKQYHHYEFHNHELCFSDLTLYTKI